MLKVLNVKKYFFFQLASLLFPVNIFNPPGQRTLTICSTKLALLPQGDQTDTQLKDTKNNGGDGIC
jgi:hypothetical protein